MSEILQPGTPAPDVTFRQGRERLSLKDFQGKKNVVLSFHIYSFTGG